MPQAHRLFFAIQPAAQARWAADDMTRRYMEAHGLRRGNVAPERLHVTLHWLGDHEQLPPELLRQATDAGGRVEMAPFDVGFDHLGSLGPGSSGLALMGGAELKPLRGFQRALATAMSTAGLGRYIRKRFNPHVSLLYSPEQVASEPIATVRWRVQELVLIESLVGDSQHEVRGRWPLRARQMALGDW